MHICDMGGKGGVGWGSNVHVNLNTHGMLCISVIWGGRVGQQVSFFLFSWCMPFEQQVSFFLFS